jgi:transaldolase
MAADGGDCEAVLKSFGHAGVNAGRMADHLQRQGADAFVDAWKDLMGCMESKSRAVTAGVGA